MKPNILLSVNSKKENYISAVENSGGTAYAEYCPEFSENFDGLLLCGGSDIHPRYYGEEINGAVNIDEKRDEAEFKLLEAFLKAGKPVMGICRGHQLINVYFGGSLIQHIDNADKHSSTTDLVHSVTAKKDSLLFELYGRNFNVNSHHHQALYKIGDSLEVIATADSGNTVEAISHKTLPVFGVQWHPERMCYNMKRENVVDSENLFKYFIKMCGENK